jgi:sortase B
MQHKDIKRRSPIKRFFALLILAVSLCVLVFSGYKLWEIQRAYQIGNSFYSDLAGRVQTEASSAAPQTPNVDIPALGVDFKALSEVNTDTVAWLFSPDTMIDYPVMKASEYDYYLHHLPDGSYNVNGTLFIDYNNAPDFSDKLTIVYGHHMQSGAMFGSLVGYKNQAYFEEHPYMYLYTEGGNYRIDLLYGCVIGAGQWRERAFMYETNVDALISYAAYNTTFESQAQRLPSDRIVAMSTCTYEFDDARYVVLGILRPEYG